LTSGRKLRRVKASLREIERLAPELGDAYLRVEVQAAPTPGLADRVREILPNAVDVVIARATGETGAPEPEKRLGRSPQELFSEYLKERGEDDARVRALFDELLDQVHAPD
jgi:exonuclease SbcD